MKTIEQIARAYWEAEESRDLDHIMSFFSLDADWGSATSRRKGQAAIREFYAGSAAQFPGLTVEVGRVFGDDTEAALEWHAVFTDRGGRTYPLSGVNLFRREGELIASLTHYEDPTPLTRAPAPIAQIARKDRFARLLSAGDRRRGRDRCRHRAAIPGRRRSRDGNRRKAGCP